MRWALLIACMTTGCALAHERSVDANVDAPLSQEALCAATGGSWRHGPCCPTRCGIECPLDCIASNCRCASDQIWDGVQGCTRSPECSP